MIPPCPIEPEHQLNALIFFGFSQGPYQPRKPSCPLTLLRLSFLGRLKAERLAMAPNMTPRLTPLFIEFRLQSASPSLSIRNNFALFMRGSSDSVPAT